jgi:hypothetical protein
MHHTFTQDVPARSRFFGPENPHAHSAHRHQPSSGEKPFVHQSHSSSNLSTVRHDQQFPPSHPYHHPFHQGGFMHGTATPQGRDTQQSHLHPMHRNGTNHPQGGWSHYKSSQQRLRQDVFPPGTNSSRQFQTPHLGRMNNPFSNPHLELPAQPTLPNLGLNSRPNVLVANLPNWSTSVASAEAQQTPSRALDISQPPSSSRPTASVHTPLRGPSFPSGSSRPSRGMQLRIEDNSRLRACSDSHISPETGKPQGVRRRKNRASYPIAPFANESYPTNFPTPTPTWPQRAWSSAARSAQNPQGASIPVSVMEPFQRLGPPRLSSNQPSPHSPSDYAHGVAANPAAGPSTPTPAPRHAAMPALTQAQNIARNSKQRVSTWGSSWAPARPQSSPQGSPRTGSEGSWQVIGKKNQSNSEA